MCMVRADGVGAEGGGGAGEAAEQALREKQFVGEHDGTCLLCHLDVIVLTGGSRLRNV